MIRKEFFGVALVRATFSFIPPFHTRQNPFSFSLSFLFSISPHHQSQNPPVFFFFSITLDKYNIICYIYINN